MKTNPINKSKWAIVQTAGDWEAIYRDGELFREGHCFSTDEVFEMLGIELDWIMPDESNPSPSPKLLSEVIPFDSEAAEKRRKEKERKDQIDRIELEIKQREAKLLKLKSANQ